MEMKKLRVSKNMKRRLILLLLASAIFSFGGYAENAESGNETQEPTTAKPDKLKNFASRLSIGGYGEAVMTYNFFSDKYLRYTDPQKYKDDKHGRFDLPHVVIFLGYDFGKGWTMGSEIEFEHGGTGSTIEIETEETGEYETETEKGGEVALEQFWIQKSFSKALNLRMGHIIVPVGATNVHHMPTEFFTNYRPEGENTILPCTWHETGISLWGRIKDWRYEVLFIPGLDSDRFTNSGWVNGGGGTPYEFKIANSFAGALRIDNYSIPGLRLSVSGYVGNSFKNTLSPTDSPKYKGVKGTVAIGSFDFAYDRYDWKARGYFDYGHLSDSEMITKYNMGMRQSSPSPQQSIGSDAIAVGIEAGYDIFSRIESLRQRHQKLFVFGRYDYYDSMYKTQGSILDYRWCGRQRVGAGVNYYPMRDIVVKCEYGIGLMSNKYNNEPTISLGIAYSGWFTK